MKTKTNSWIIIDRDTREPIAETSSEVVVERLRSQYEAILIEEEQ